MTKLLTLKHWQLFGLLMGLPLILQFAAMGSFMTDPNSTIMLAFPIMMVFVVVLFFGWFYALGINLHKKLPATTAMNLTRFKIFLFITVVYMLSISVFMFYMFSNFLSGEQPNPAIFAVIVPLHMFSMFCIFYCIYFIAKALKTVELQKPVIFSDFAGDFALIWFYPLGIWIIQPRINKLFDPTLSGDSNQLLDHNI